MAAVEVEGLRCLTDLRVLSFSNNFLDYLDL